MWLGRGATGWSHDDKEDAPWPSAVYGMGLSCRIVTYTIHTENMDIIHWLSRGTTKKYCIGPVQTYADMWIEGFG